MRINSDLSHKIIKLVAAVIIKAKPKLTRYIC